MSLWMKEFNSTCQVSLPNPPPKKKTPESDQTFRYNHQFAEKKEDRATCIITQWKYNQQKLGSEKLHDK